MTGERVADGLDLADALPAGEHVERTVSLSLPAEAGAVRTARAFVLEHAPPLTQESLDTVALLTSELVTNAVIHARTPLEVGVYVSEHHLLVTVHDLDIGHVEVQRGREGGWGLGLVRSLSDESSMTRHPGGGKTAWFRVGRDR
jgi:anti-sigma regulatory factor (Ser/Thr protein kinase)